MKINPISSILINYLYMCASAYILHSAATINLLNDTNYHYHDKVKVQVPRSKVVKPLCCGQEV